MIVNRRDEMMARVAAIETDHRVTLRMKAVGIRGKEFRAWAATGHEVRDGILPRGEETLSMAAGEAGSFDTRHCGSIHGVHIGAEHVSPPETPSYMASQRTYWCDPGGQFVKLGMDWAIQPWTLPQNMPS